MSFRPDRTSRRIRCLPNAMQPPVRPVVSPGQLPRILVVVLLPLVLGACASTYDCTKTEAYTKAKQLDPLVSPAGLKVASPNPDMDIPDTGNGPVGTYDDPPPDIAASEIADCLIAPPPMEQTGF